MHCRLPLASVLRLYVYMQNTPHTVTMIYTLHMHWSVSGVDKSLTLVSKLDKTCTLHLNTPVHGYSFLTYMHLKVVCFLLSGDWLSHYHSVGLVLTAVLLPIPPVCYSISLSCRLQKVYVRRGSGLVFFRAERGEVQHEQKSKLQP